MQERIVSLKFTGDLDKHNLNISLSIDLNLVDIFKGERSCKFSHQTQQDLKKCLAVWRKGYSKLKGKTRLKLKRVLYQDDSYNEIRNCLKSTEDLKQRITDFFKDDIFCDIRRILSKELKPEENIRIIISVEDKTLWSIPWCSWGLLREFPRAEIALRAISKQEDYCKNRFPLRRENSQVRILAILGDSSGINITPDYELLDNLKDTEVKLLWKPKLQEIREQLNSHSWDILFFAGHSESYGNEEGRIFVTSHISLPTSELVPDIKHSVDKGLRLAIFNSCDGLGIASDLAQAYIPQMIVMREQVPDKIAVEFLELFLLAFSTSDFLYLAVRYAREQLQRFESQFPYASWLPIIVENSFTAPPTWEQLKGNHTNRLSKSEETIYIGFSDSLSKNIEAEETIPSSNQLPTNSYPNSREGKVEKTITPNSSSITPSPSDGRVKYYGASWPARFYPAGIRRTVFPYETVKIVGREGIYLLVIPSDYEFSKNKRLLRPKRWTKFIFPN